MVKTKWLKHPNLWFQSVFNSSVCNCGGGAVCIIGKTHEAPQVVFRLLLYSLSYFIGASGFLLYKVLAARKKNVSNARARKNKYTAHMLADARKDHSTSLLLKVEKGPWERGCSPVKTRGVYHLHGKSGWNGTLVMLQDFPGYN